MYDVRRTVEGQARRLSNVCRRHPERDGMTASGQSFKVLCRQTPEKRTAVMIRQLWTLSVNTRAFLRRYMPTNILAHRT